ncbi:hypothetical protein A0H81_13622 [Grifola frondosa]|uniref:Uncharacterized protein n=1 Tax=Grifola frondosa TaxID=5627 RepID=A0A1C7LQI6_GRIFR|nr:hypothetical protein A0H81_13622 [Grifola frondosa]
MAPRPSAAAPIGPLPVVDVLGLHTPPANTVALVEDPHASDAVVARTAVSSRTASIGTGSGINAEETPTPAPIVPELVHTDNQLDSDVPNGVASGLQWQEFSMDSLLVTGLTNKVEDSADESEAEPDVQSSAMTEASVVPQDMASLGVDHVSQMRPHIKTKWSPPKGIATCGRGNDGAGYEGSDEDDIFGDEISADEGHSVDEFRPVPDDEETTMAAAQASSYPITISAQDNESGASRERSALPRWLMNDYENTRERLASEMRNNASRRPTCYDRGSYTDGSACAFLFADRKFQPTPEDFYRPIYFVWLPHVLVGRIPCPNCVSASRVSKGAQPVYLRCHGWSKAPRRVVDLERCIWIIGYRYYCPHPECKKSYQSWSPALLAALPRALSLDFDHHLTYRNGITEPLMAFMRTLYHRGVGPVPLAQIIRSFHIRYYERLHLQYVEMVYARQNSAFAHLLPKFKAFGSFDDRDGYAGYTPSARYFRDVYVNFMASHASEMDQYTAMLPAKLLQVDHTFKIMDHIGKINGVRVFSALHTSINEYSEIRSMVMTPTKAHDQFMPALATISDSLKSYGHDPIELIFTDNVRGDKAELEHNIPSLLADVVSVPDSSSLEHLTLPLDCTIIMLSSTFQVNTRIGSILADLRINEEFYAAVDMEWSVDRDSGVQGKVALLSIMFDREIFLLPLSSYLQEGHLKLPVKLLTFLRTPSIRKVGVKVSSDLTRLFNDCGFTAGRDESFTGALDLGQLAKECNATVRATVGLADLAASVLRRFLPKDPTIRVSTHWDDKNLSDSQIKYAALDVFAFWRIFQALSSIPIGQTIDSSTVAGTPISLFSPDHSRVVARGFVTPDQPKQHLGITSGKNQDAPLRYLGSGAVVARSTSPLLPSRACLVLTLPSARYPHAYAP